MMEFLFPEEEMQPRPKPQPPVVQFSSANITQQVVPGTLLMDAARDAGLTVPQQCGGVAVCGWCKMKILEGHEHLSPVQAPEERLIRWGKLREDERASCQAEVLGNVTVG